MTSSSLIRHPSFTAFALQILLAYEWISGGIEKMTQGRFVSEIEKTLGRFESGNPHGWYVRSILRIAKNAPEIFGQLVQWGELFVGIGLIAAILWYGFGRDRQQSPWTRFIAIPALLGGMFMNINFYYAAGWTNPSTGGLNMLMFWAQLILILFWIHSRDEKAVRTK